MEAKAASPPILRLTEQAASQVKTMQAEQADHAGKILRVYVEQGGCSGMQYGLVFDERRDEDHSCEWFGVPVVVDAFSAQYLQGAVVDFSDSLNAGGFKITNPNARESCGCGRSFQGS